MIGESDESLTEKNPSSELDEDIKEVLLTALSDPTCRAILNSVSEQALSAGELAHELDLPLSTAYRKLDQLTDTPLVTATYRLAADGKHPKEYHCTVDRIHIRLGEGNDPVTALSLLTRRSEGR